MAVVFHWRTYREGRLQKRGEKSTMHMSGLCVFVCFVMFVLDRETEKNQNYFNFDSLIEKLGKHFCIHLKPEPK